jgi:hypothetical protein
MVFPCPSGGRQRGRHRLIRFGAVVRVERIAAVRLDEHGAYSLLVTRP